MTITIFLAIVAVVATGAATYYKGVADTYRHARFDIHIYHLPPLKRPLADIKKDNHESNITTSEE